MPIVPTDQNRVSADGLPGVRSTVNFTPAAFGADIGRAAQGIGQQASRLTLDYMEREREKQDTAVLMGAERELQDWENKALFTPGTGAYAQRGSASFGLTDKLLPDYDKTYSAIESRLTDRQKEAFRQRNANRRSGLERDLMRHVGREAEQYRSQETDAYVKTQLETAKLYASDPPRFEAALRTAEDAFMAGNPDLPPVVLAQGVKAIRSNARATVVENMIENDPLEAQRYFDTYRDQFTAADAAQLDRVLKPARIEAQAGLVVDRARRTPVAGTATRTTAEPGARPVSDLPPITTTPLPDDADPETVASQPPPSYVTFRRRLESGGNPNAKNPKSSATGADQFIKSTWLAMIEREKPAWAEGLSQDELLDLRRDPEKSGEMAAALDRVNTRALRAAGQEPTNANLYAAHHFGVGKGVIFARADGDTPMTDILSKEQVEANPYLRNLTKSQVITEWHRRAGSAADAPAAEIPEIVVTMRGEGGTDAGGLSVPPPIASPESASAAILSKPSHADILARINAEPNPAVRRAALARYQTEIEIEKIRDQERTEAITETINTKVESADPSLPLNQILTPNEFAWAAEEGKVGAWEGRLKQRVAGLAPKTNPAKFDELQSTLIRAENGDPKALDAVRKMDVSTMFTDLDPQARDYIQNRRLAIISAGNKAKEKELPDFASEDDILDQEVFGKLGIGRNPNKDDDEKVKNQRYAFYQMYWAEKARRQEQKGAKLTSKEVQQIAKDLMLPFSRQVRDQFFWFDGSETRRGFEVGEVPALDRVLIGSAYRKTYGRDPTPEEIRVEYMRAKGFKPTVGDE